MRSKTFFRNALLLIAPFLVMIILNEIYRIHKEDDGGIYNGVYTLNISKPNFEKCTWKCHNDTKFCKDHHVSFLRNYLTSTDLIYNRIIKELNKGNAYILNNILYLVILTPMVIWFFMYKSWNIQDEINLLKNKINGNYSNDL